MDPTIIAAAAGVFGSICGGSASVATAWVTHKTRARREAVLAELAKRETLYGEFITECSSRVIDAYERNLDSTERVLPIYALLNRIRLCASEAVLAQATVVVESIMDQYFAPNISIEEFHKRAHDGGIDPLKAFSECCRSELLSMHAAI